MQSFLRERDNTTHDYSQSIPLKNDCNGGYKVRRGLVIFLCTVQIEASTSPRGIPRAFDRFNLPGGGEFDPHA